MKLDCCARAGTRDAFSPYSILFWLTAAVYVIVLDFLFILIEIALGKSSLDANERATDAMIIFLIVLGSLFLLFILSNTLRAREHMRKKYDIPASFPYEDACCAMLCNPCTVCQMARHSADYQRHLGACCTRNGLMETVPNPV